MKYSEVINKMTLEEKASLCVGKDYWNSQEIKRLGIPQITMSDGPHGLRVQKGNADNLGVNESEAATCFPALSTVANSWDKKIAYKLGEALGKEAAYQEINIVLGPGVNIKRSPLCGRNFEYFSEDPYLTGQMGAEYVKGLQKNNVGACVKHFAVNNQENRRRTIDVVVDERALREIYLRGFEICIKESRPNTLMTSYNKINGVWSHYNYDLVTTILRKEWGYEGVVITDWWMQKSVSPEFPKLRDNAYRVRAQVDVLMPGNMGHLHKKYHSDGTLLKSIDKPEGITRGELQRTAKNVLKLIIKIGKV